MTKPSERDLDKARKASDKWFNERFHSFDNKGQLEISEHDLDALDKEFAKCLSAERMSLPESVKRALKLCDEEDEVLQHCSPYEVLPSETYDEIRRAIKDIEEWQQGEIDTGKEE